jgi:homoserine dehydrogenase
VRRLQTIKRRLRRIECRKQKAERGEHRAESTEQKAESRAKNRAEMTHRFTISRQFAGIVVYHKTGRPVLEAGKEEGEYVSQALMAEKNVIVVNKAMLARDHHDPIGLVPFGPRGFL